MDLRGEQARRQALEQERALRERRARFIALGSLLAVIAVAIAIVTGSTGGSGSHAARTTALSAAAKKRTPTTSSATKAGTASVPILNYNVINARPPNSTAPADLYVPTNEFSAQMNALKAAGWHAVTLNQLQAYWTHGTTLGPGKPIVITFDGGYASHFTNALPVLKQVGWVGVEDLQATGLPPSEGGLTDSQLKGLLSAGWELDAEGVSQPDLTSLSPTQLTSEVTGSRQTIQARYSVPVNWFAYPTGRYNAMVVAAARAAGFTGAMTEVAGWASPQADRFRLPRIRVVGGTSPTSLLAQITAAQASTSAPASVP